MIWSDLTRAQKLQIIRRGYIDGHSNSRIGAAQGVSKNTIVAMAWRWYLSPHNAHGWMLGACRPSVPSYEREPRKRLRVPVAVRRARLPNQARDPASQAAVAALNALPLTDLLIATELGVDQSMISAWRRGRARVTPFMLQCVTTTVARLS